jgi:hypothetical protein
LKYRNSFGSASVVSVMVLVATFATVACSGKSGVKNGAGGTAGATGGTGGAGGTAGKGGASGAGAGGASGGRSGSGGSAGASGGTAGQAGSAAAGGTTAGEGGAGGAGGEGGGMQDDRPVLERPIREELTCVVTTPIDDRGLDWANGDVAATPSGTFVAWGRPASMNVDDAVMLAGISATAMLDAPEPLVTYSAAYATRPRLAASSRGLSVAWAEAGLDEMSTLHVGELSPTGDVTQLPKAVAGVSERIGDVALAPTADGNALLFVNTAVDYSSMVVRFALLDADGTLDGDVVDVSIAQSEGQLQAGELLAIPGGFAATYTTWTGAEFEAYLAFLNEGGAVRGEPILLNDSRPYLGQSLLVRGDELIVAHVDEIGTYDQSNIALVAVLSRFDLESHERTKQDVRVQSPTVNEEVVNPTLFAVGDDVGLIWSRGSVIYICAGCMPDNHLEAVVMDGDDFTPLTEILVFPNDQPMGGYVRPLVAPVGDDFAVVTDLRFHVSGNMATGAFRCTPTP